MLICKILSYFAILQPCLSREYLIYWSLRVCLKPSGFIGFIPLITAFVVMLLHTILSIIIQGNNSKEKKLSQFWLENRIEIQFRF